MFVSDVDQPECMKNHWLAMERYRLQCAEAWPDSSFKRTTVAAIRSAMEALLPPAENGLFLCRRKPV